LDLEKNKLLLIEVKKLLKEAKSKVAYTINKTMVTTYYQIGKSIVEHLQSGNNRAEYGKSLLKKLSIELSNEFGKGFSVDNLENMRQFYLVYSKSETLSRKTEQPKFNLSWSHYLKLSKLDTKDERKFYEIESIKGNWSVRELKRQLDSALFQRLALSRNKEEVNRLSLEGQIIEKPEDSIKEPYILEFLGLEEKAIYSESDLENAIIDKLETFLLELGKGFTFDSRQKRISFDERHFYIDLVFYNRFLKSFVLIDLKIGELKHQDIGQMQMYVNYYDREIKLPEESPTIGLILCKYKSKMVVEYTLPENQNQIFASKYQTVLPSKDELKQLLKLKDSGD